MAGELTVVYSDGRKETVEIKMSDLVHFERRFGVGFAEVQDNPKMDHIMFMIWNALRRTHREDRPYDEFLDDVEDFEAEGVDELVPSLPPPV